MSPGLSTTPEQAPVLDATLSMPYTLTTGRAAGAFLTELANRKIVGSRCADCARVLVPAQDFCPQCGGEAAQLVELPHVGVVNGCTTTPEGTLALIRLDGADGDLVHRVVGDGAAAVSIGDRVRAVWAEEPTGNMLDLAGFEPAGGGGEAGGPSAVGELETDPEVEAITWRPYHMDLHYRHSYGPFYGRLFDELGASRRILGTKCPSCKNVLVPPREFCEQCYVRTEQWVDVSDHGRIQGFSLIHLEFVGQLREPPYVYAEIVLDGSATRLIHSIGGIDVEEARARLRPGTRVRAVWKEADEIQGTLADIRYFEPIFDDEPEG
jgi:uncharacterized OB-fold protein